MRYFIAAGLLLVLATIHAHTAPMSRMERQRLVAHLEMTRSWLADELAGLSPAQARFRPAPGAWNIVEVLDHLVVTGPIYWQDLQKSLAAPPRASKRGTDDGVLWYGIDRAQHQTALPAEGAIGQTRDLASGLDAFRKLHTKLIDYAKTTDDDLRGHVVDREGCDAYQWLLLISTHTQRHILQIREIKQSARFPTK